MSNENTAASTEAATIIAEALPLSARVWVGDESGDVRVYVTGGAATDGDYIDVYVYAGRLHRDVEAHSSGAAKWIRNMLRSTCPMAALRERVTV